MVTSVRLRVLELGAVLVAIYGLALTFAIRGMPPAIMVGLAVDLTVTATLATWWLGVQSGVLSRRSLLVVFAAGAATTRFLLPGLPGGAGQVAIGIVLALELGMFALTVVRGRRLLRRLRRDAHLPWIIRLADALEDVGFPRRVARIATTEMATTALAFTGWFRRAPRHGFTVHRTYLALATHAVLLMLIAVETVALHLLLSRATELGAWISTGLSIYAALWLLGDAHALRLGRIRVERDEVVIEIARRWAAVIPRRMINAARRETTAPEGAVDLSIETPTIALELSEPITARGPFGLTRTGSLVALTIDDPDSFLAALAR